MADIVYTLQLVREGGEPAGEPIGLDSPLGRGGEALRWDYRLAEGQSLDPGEIQMTPLWREEGAPRVRAVEFSTPDHRHSVELDARQLYRRDAKHCSTRLVEQKVLSEGEPYDFVVAAHRQGNGASQRPPVVWLQYEPDQAESAPPADVTMDDEFADERDIEVYLEAEVLDQARQLAREARDEETGSILLGHLFQPAGDARPRPFVHVTAHVPADSGKPGKLSFEFNPECFNKARAVIERRDRQESMCGWFHCHPQMCPPKCPPEKREVCALNQPFLSDADLILMETIFPAPFHLALLVSDNGKSLTPSLWGWRDGFMARRSFHLTNTQQS